jgi:RNA polymerase sigma-70 factor (ECF subfamily)
MREVIALRDMQGKSYEEISDILNVPLGTVKSRVSRAREKLSVILKKSSELFSSTSVQ